MSSLSTNLGGVPQKGAMRFAHRLFVVAAAILVVLAEVVVADSFFAKTKAPMSLYTAFTLSILILIPLGIALIFYMKMKRVASLSPVNEIPWPLIRFMWTFFLFICYTLLIATIMLLLAAKLHI